MLDLLYNLNLKFDCSFTLYYFGRISKDDDRAVDDLNYNNLDDTLDFGNFVDRLDRKYGYAEYANLFNMKLPIVKMRISKDILYDPITNIVGLRYGLLCKPLKKGLYLETKEIKNFNIIAYDILGDDYYNLKSIVK